MSDLIDRQAAIDFIDAGRLGNPNEPRWSDNEIVNFLKSRPSVQQWIPCSERLPENPKSSVDIKTYLVCFDSGDITDLMWCDGWNCCFNDMGMVSKVNELTGVIAWMPLPKPYREEK